MKYIDADINGWIPVEEELPPDGEWILCTDGKDISVERYKMDLQDHFFPNGRWFEWEDVVAWQSLPKPYKRTKVHEIKLRESFADAIFMGEKTFEVRWNDRNYKKGDYVIFNIITDLTPPILIDHPLNTHVFEITYVLEGWGIEKGYCAFGIKDLGGYDEINHK